MARRPQHVTDAEREVLRALWDAGPATIRTLADRLYPGGATSEYATVQKLLERLEDKGHVSVYIGTSADRDGTNPRHTFEIVRFDPTTGAATKVTSAADGVSALVSVSDDGQWITFPSPTDLTGGNHDQSIELFVMDSTGATITQLTSDPAPNAGSVSSVAISGNGGKVDFLANTNPSDSTPGTGPRCSSWTVTGRVFGS